MRPHEKTYAARWWEMCAQSDCGDITCLLCPRRCVIKNNSAGLCGARKNIEGALFSLAYGLPAAIAVDPIEKKPLYHFYPGASTLSLGTLGCNMRCLHCQNASLSFAAEGDFEKQSAGGRGYCEPEEIIRLSFSRGSRIISWTYNEPLIWAEYIIECMREARKRGLSSVLVSAGLASPDVWGEVLSVTDACSLDIKGWGDFYKRLTGFSGLDFVLQNALAAHKAGCHIEIVTNIMHGWNDDDASLFAIAEWIGKELSPNIPWHITASRPAHELMSLKPTPPETIRRAMAIGRKAGLRFVYGGNIADTETPTFCPKCAAALIRREAFHVRENLCAENLRANGGICPACGTKIYGRFD
jgi:pyruvate formate lyase activating enzyme